MKKHIKLFQVFHFAAIALILAIPGTSIAAVPSPGKQVAQELKVKTGEKEITVDYWIFLPKSYDNKKPWPLMLFLHGAGERGDNINQVVKWGPPKRVLNKSDFPFVLVSPQCPKNQRWDTAVLHTLVEHAAKSNKIDRSRMYCTGLSMGGYGTWAMIAKYPNLFAAVIPICGGGNPATAKKIAEMPIWAFHGGDDRVVPASRSQSMVNAIKKEGGTKATLTIYPGVNHNSWSKTYANEKIYSWLLSNRLKTKK